MNSEDIFRKIVNTFKKDGMWSIRSYGFLETFIYRESLMQHHFYGVFMCAFFSIYKGFPWGQNVFIVWRPF